MDQWLGVGCPKEGCGPGGRASSAKGNFQKGCQLRAVRGHIPRRWGSTSFRPEEEPGLHSTASATACALLSDAHGPGGVFLLSPALHSRPCASRKRLPL